MEEFQCIYCAYASPHFNCTIDDVIVHHPDDNLKIKIRFFSEVGVSSYTKNFNLNANQLKREMKFITPNADQKTIKNSRIVE